MSDSPITLPEKYYLDYFHYLLDFVEDKYEHVLDEPEHQFYQSFRNLSEDAQCLYLRFSNRKGNFFRINKLSYQEISNINAAKQELLQEKFIQINANKDPVQFRLFTKAELLSHYDFLEKNQKKEELLLELTDEALDSIHAKEEIAETLKTNEVAFIKLLFFGNNHYQMTDFVIRDIGNIKLEKLDESKFTPWCQTRDEALAVMQIAELQQLVRATIKEGLNIEEMLEDIPWAQLLKYPTARKKGGKLLIEIGKYLEKKQAVDLAYQHYLLTKQYPSRERLIRILNKKDEQEKAVAIAEQILEDPVNASEYTFASDFLRKSGVRINRSMTDRLKEAPRLAMFKPKKGRIETAVLNTLAEDEWNGFHSENFVWRGIFGLIFWDEIFTQELGAFHHPLQREPSDLEDSNFFLNRKEKMTRRLQLLSTKKKLIQHISEIYQSKKGTANRLVVWHESLIPAIEIIIQYLPLKALKKIMEEIPKNIRENSSGFPDLFIWKEKEYQFYEVKSPNDQLSAQQLFWLEYMQQVGINAEVLKIEYLEE